MTNRIRRQPLLRANKFQRPVIHFVVWAALVTVIVVAFCVSFIYNSVLEEVMNPTGEVPLVKLSVLLALLLVPLIFLIIIVWIHKLTNRLVGAFERIIGDLDHVVKTNEKKHIKVRKSDKLAGELVHRINKLIDKIP